MGQAFGKEMPAGMLCINQVKIGNVIYDFAIGFFGNILVETTVTGFHVEDGDMKAFGHVS
jgi:hypothetical protein